MTDPKCPHCESVDDKCLYADLLRPGEDHAPCGAYFEPDYDRFLADRDERRNLEKEDRT